MLTQFHYVAFLLAAACSSINPSAVARRRAPQCDAFVGISQQIPRATPCGAIRLIIAYLYYNVQMVSGDLIREARLRAGLTQAELGGKIGKPQSVVARWERGDVVPSFETLREVVRGCELELHFHLSRFDDSNATVIDEHLKMTPAQRFTDLLTRVRFHDQIQERRRLSSDV
jgi:transcriptional regulator with XRE-family HTH domain